MTENLKWQHAKTIAKTIYIGLVHDYGSDGTKMILRALRKKEYRPGVDDDGE